MIKDAAVVSNQPEECFTFRPLDWNRKAEAEKKRVVDAATEILYKHACATKGELIDGAKALYDAGYLRLPANKD
jgi:hypothetical protein